MKEYKKEEKGITLIALVITIIILLILAGITIAALSGENGILTRASEAKQKTGREEIVEKAKLEILEAQAEKEGNITNAEAKAIIAKYDKEYNSESTEFKFKTNENNEEYFTTKEGFDILVSEIWENIPEETGKIKFSLDAGGYKEDFEVERGTTWKQFFDDNNNHFLENNLRWFYSLNDGTVALYVDEVNASLYVSCIKVGETFAHIQDKIIEGQYDMQGDVQWENQGGLYGFFGNS